MGAASSQLRLCRDPLLTAAGASAAGFASFSAIYAANLPSRSCSSCICRVLLPSTNSVPVSFDWEMQIEVHSTRVLGEF